jgi:hypothetical protein
MPPHIKQSRATVTSILLCSEIQSLVKCNTQWAHQLKDFQFAYRMGVCEHYHLLVCDALLLANALGKCTASIFRVSRSHTVGGILTSATVGRVRHQAQQFLHWCQQKASSLSMLSNCHLHWTILCIVIASDSAHVTINCPCGGEMVQFLLHFSQHVPAQ